MSQSKTSTLNQYESASQFMRSRRPEQFSDTVETFESAYPRSVFDHFLESITARNDERLFETFARRLAEKEICPNLVPQTGPVGGGDSKVDSETYPVSEEIASAWYHNEAVAAGKERWAFAISAKKVWRSKCQSDVRKIAETKRGYTHIFFITNQYVKDKTRGELQDELSKECNSRVSILDRTWILEKTYENHRLDIAFEVFSLVPEVQRRQQKGPRDAEREKELLQLDERLKNYDNYGGSVLRRAEDALDGALLARALNYSKNEVDGRFNAALEMLGSLTNSPLSLRFRYAQAWTRFWWFDDATGMERLYDSIFEFAEKEQNAWQLERVNNLWYCLVSAERSGQLPSAVARVKERGRSLANALVQVRDSDAKTTNSYFARCLLAFLNVAINPKDPDLDTLVSEISEVVKGAENHADFPMESVSKIVNELSNILDDNGRLDQLLDNLLEIVSPRLSNESAAENLVERADKKLSIDKPYEAIALLGRAQTYLRTVESRKESIYVLVRLGQAYESVGLLWAARAMLLRALERSLRPLREEHQLPKLCVSLAAKLSWAELQLGRPTSVLSTIHLQSIYESIVGKSSNDINEIDEPRMRDCVLGMLILQSDICDIAKLSRLPDALISSSLDLNMSRSALLYALGYDEALEYEMQMTKTEILDFFELWSNQPAREDLPSHTIWHIGHRTTYFTKILGCVVSLQFETSMENILVAESILSAVEAYAATTVVDEWYPRKSELHCTLTAVSTQESIFSYNMKEAEFDGSEIQLNYNPALANEVALLENEGSNFIEIISVIVLSALFPKSESSVEKLLKNSEALNRTVLSLGLPLIHENVFGIEGKYKIEHWIDESSVTANYGLLRTKAWKATTKTKLNNADQDTTNKLKHSNIMVTDIINVEFWDAAKWNGTAVIQTGQSEFHMGLMFADIGAGKRIFKAWRARFGERDKHSALKVIVITGVNKFRPLEYRIMISPNPDLVKDTATFGSAYFLSRVNTMTPTNDTTLKIFEQICNQGLKVSLTPVGVSGGRPELTIDLSLEISGLTLVPAWKIKDNDIELTALQPDDDPFIPEGTAHPPVEQALRKLKSRR